MACLRLIKAIRCISTVAALLRAPLIATSHAATIGCGLHREYLRDRGERCGADGMTNEEHRRNRNRRSSASSRRCGVGHGNAAREKA